MRVLLFFFIIYSSSVLAWDAAGHELVARIAAEQLTPLTKQKVDELVKILEPHYPASKGFKQIASWPDVIKMRDVTAFNTWHYIAMPFTRDGSSLFPIPKKDNVVWAIQECIKVLSSERTIPLEKAFFLRFLVHIVGDIHQPLHCATQVSARWPEGDRGGTAFPIDDRYAKNLHQFWDQGLNSFRLKHRAVFAKELIKQYPRVSFFPRVNNLEPWQWANESHQLAKQIVYRLEPGDRPNKEYLKGISVAQQQVTLAGYRLGAVLNKIFDPENE